MKTSNYYLITLLLLLTFSYSLKFSKNGTLSHLKIPTNIDQLRSKQLQTHNKYRKLHNAPALKLSDTLNKKAQNYSDYLAKYNLFQHSNTANVGENLFWMSGMKYTPGKASDDWYSEISLYDFNKANYTPGTGHFTQLVWVGTKQVGFGFSVINGQTYVVAMYSPPGNYIGQFAQNVLRK